MAGRRGESHDGRRELRCGWPYDVERRQRGAELLVPHRPEAFAHGGSSNTPRRRAIALESRDLAVPSRTSSTSAVSLSERPSRNRYPITSRSGGGRRLSAAINI